jgi:hypothetical protein
MTAERPRVCFSVISSIRAYDPLRDGVARRFGFFAPPEFAVTFSPKIGPSWHRV